MRKVANTFKQTNCRSLPQLQCLEQLIFMHEELVFPATARVPSPMNQPSPVMFMKGIKCAWIDWLKLCCVTVQVTNDRACLGVLACASYGLHGCVCKQFSYWEKECGCVRACTCVCACWITDPLDSPSASKAFQAAQVGNHHYFFFSQHQPTQPKPCILKNWALVWWEKEVVVTQTTSLCDRYPQSRF